MAIFPLYSADLMPIWCRFDALSKPSSNRHQIARTQPAGRPRAAGSGALRAPRRARGGGGGRGRCGPALPRGARPAQKQPLVALSTVSITYVRIPPLTFQSCLPGVIFEKNHHDGLLFLLAFFAWNCDNASVCRVMRDGGQRWANQSGRQCT